MIAALIDWNQTPSLPSLRGALRHAVEQADEATSNQVRRLPISFVVMNHYAQAFLVRNRDSPRLASSGKRLRLALLAMTSENVLIRFQTPLVVEQYCVSRIPVRWLSVPAHADPGST